MLGQKSFIENRYLGFHTDKCGYCNPLLGHTNLKIAVSIKGGGKSGDHFRDLVPCQLKTTVGKVKTRHRPL